jgi:hypothetical protein
MANFLNHPIVAGPPRAFEKFLREVKGPLIFLGLLLVAEALYLSIIVFLYFHPPGAAMPLQLYVIGEAAFLRSINASEPLQLYQALQSAIQKLQMTPRQVHLAEAYFIGVFLAKLGAGVIAVWCLVLGTVSAFKRRSLAP